MSYLEQAIKAGYAHITGAEGHRKITYVSSLNHTESYDDPEEQVRAEYWAALIYKYEYPVTRIRIEVVVPNRTQNDRADIVVFQDDDCKRPYAVVVCKKDGVTDVEFNQAIEEGIGNATWVKLRANYVVIIAGSTHRVYDVSDKFGIFEREKNIVADMPYAYGNPQEYRFYKGDPNSDIAPVSQEELMSAIKKCHNTLWGGGRLSPPTAFGELCKVIFVKISDEQKPRKKSEPYEFQIKTYESSASLARRINTLYDEQKARDPEVFTESIKVDERVLRTVVSHLESINLSKTDLDVKGFAFERFMDGFFKGDFGQYFTPRPIIKFAIHMLKPNNKDYVLDTSCGSGGFLLYAMDYIRELAPIYFDGEGEQYKFWHDFASTRLFGIEINDEIARVAKMNMIVHDDGHSNIISTDALDSIDKMTEHNKGFARNRFDLVLTNPPFGSNVRATERAYLGSYMLGNTYDKKGKANVRKNQSSEVLFIERIWQFLKPKTGRAAIVLPDGILTNSSSQYVRDFILDHFQLLAVVSLPQSAFAHFGAGVKASIIFVRKRGTSEKPSDEEAVFMAAPEEIGYDATGRTNDRSQLPEIVKEYEAFCKDNTPFFV
jgi:type I restriction enzyme M protein